jgi:hypothetical protein
MLNPMLKILRPSMTQRASIDEPIRLSLRGADRSSLAVPALDRAVV